MATTLFLARHAVHGLVDQVLCGRMPGVHLGDAGRRQATLLARRLESTGLAAVYTSPLERAQDTAAIIALGAGHDPVVDQALVEIDFGTWTGHRFDALQDDPNWRHWNAERGTARPPGGEPMAEVQRRVMHWAEAAAEQHPDAAIAAVSHGDVIKAMVAAVLGLPLDHYARFEIGPASLTTIILWPGGGAKLVRMNEAPA
ncbi:histidine phosphatase family protein [Dankookia sp. GCM10030260]|uniref:histidine phosphatase family protein n=1 Tax=Dankookia sp. GCM10030260 TaxID=3273390 RepID=UPI00360A0206